MRTITLVGPRGLRLATQLPASRRERARGLRGRDRALRPHEAMLFRRCRSVHTLGMRFPIAVAGLDRWFGVRWIHEVGPNRVVQPHGGTRHILELHADADVRPGDRLRVETQPERRRGEAPTALRRSRR